MVGRGGVEGRPFFFFGLLFLFFLVSALTLASAWVDGCSALAAATVGGGARGGFSSLTGSTFTLFLLRVRLFFFLRAAASDRGAMALPPPISEEFEDMPPGVRVIVVPTTKTRPAHEHRHRPSFRYPLNHHP